MKRRRERRKRYSGKMHKTRAFLRVHVAKELKESAKLKKRAVLVNKGDTVAVMRGTHKGKSAKVKKVSHAKGLVYLEGITARNARGVENMAPFQPSNLKLTALKESAYRKKFMTGE